MDIKINKKARIPAGIVTALLLITVILDFKTFFVERFNFDVFLYIFCIVGAFIIGAMILYDFKFKKQHVETFTNTALALLSPVVTITMTECLNNIFVYDMTYLGFAGNYVIILVFLFIVYVASGSYRLPLIIINPILFVFALINFYVKEFRGTPFVPMDFASATTGANVMSEYTFRITHQVMIAIVLLVFLVVLGIKLKTPLMSKKQKIIYRGSLGGFSVLLLLLFYFTNFFANLGVKPDFWNQTRGYKNYGFVCSFFVNTKYLYVTTPTGYDSENVEWYVDKTVGKDDDIPAGARPVEKTPDIICIMNESLSDLSVLGNLETNIDFMPFLRNLRENTIKGNLFVPVIGAGTSNTEYEFLTGNTTAFFPGGSNAYMLYVDGKAPSMVSTLNSQGYNSFAFHPYYSSGWNRVNVYNHFGFSLFKSLGNLIDMSIMQQYQQTNDAELLQQLVEEAYPDSTDMLLRTYISDSYDYKVLIEDYENRDPSSPYFVFNVTMQNHGGYNKQTSNFKQEVYATNLSQDYPRANQYLSLVKRSDDAFKELINYFSQVDEPVIICMFGDHQPSIETEFIEELLGQNLSTLSVADEQKRHMTPFYIWANYDIEEAEIERMSSNYLSSLVLKTAGIKLTEYNKYLLKLYETVPVIDTVGYIDNDGNCYAWNATSQYTELLKEYEYVQYNNVFDTRNKKDKLYYHK